MSISKSDLRKSLSRIIDVIIEEADQNQEFADKLGQALASEDGVSEGAPTKRLKTVAVPGDPFQIFQAQGEPGLRLWLDGLDLAQLKQIVRQHRLDPTRNSDKWKTRERFVELIMTRLPARSRQGESFRHYGEGLSPADASARKTASN